MAGHEYKVSNEADVLPARALIIIAVVTMTLFTLGGILAWVFLARYDRAHVDTLSERVVMVRELNMIDQSLIWVDETIAEWIARERRELDSYGWDNRAGGTVHIPIEQAMERVIQEKSP